jgi:hypothetical protein
MDGDSDCGDDTLEEHAEEAETEVEEKTNKNMEEDEKQEEGTAAVKQDAEANIRREKKKRSDIFKACKKLLHL